jgi:hypothetical protein
MRSLSKPDWLGELQGITVFVGAVAVVGSVAQVAVAALGDAGIPVDLEARYLDGVAGAHAGAEGVTVAADGTVEAVVTDPSVRQVLLSTLTWLPTAVLAVAVLTLLVRILRDARSGDPFTVLTVRRLRVLAAVCLVGGAVVTIVESVCATALMATVLPATGGFSWSLTLSVGWVFAGFAFLALGELVRRGLALREELDGVV